MHFIPKNARQAWLLPLPIWRSIVFLCFCILILSSCTENNAGQFETTPYIDSIRDRAGDIADYDGDIAGIVFFDSVFRKYRKATLADRFEYYYFMYDKYSDLKEFGRSEQYIDSMFWLLETTDNTRNMPVQYAKVHILRADILYREGNFTEAYEYYYRAKVLADKGVDTCLLGFYNYKVALVLYRGEKYGESIDNFKEAYAKMTACNNDIAYYYRAQEIMDNIGLAYYYLNAPDSAIWYYNKALDLIDKGPETFGNAKDNLFNMAAAVVYGNMGSAFVEKRDYGRAEELFKKSIAINSQKGFDNTDAQYTRIKLAQLYLSQNKLTDARTILNEVNDFLSARQSMEVALRWNNVMWQYWDKLNNKQQAFENLHRYNFLRDSLNTSRNKMLRMDIDERVENLYTANEIKSLRKKSQERAIYLSVACIVVALLFIIILLGIQNRRKSKKNIAILTELHKNETEQKKRLEGLLSKVERSGKEKDRILKAVSHDMRSPVNSAMALSELLLLDDNLTGQQKEYLELIKHSCSNALNLTKDLLEIATLNKENIKIQPVDINKLVKENIDLLHFRAARKYQNIDIHLLPNPVEIAINPEKIARVINNLVSNAIKFSPENATIGVALREIDEGVQLSVHDEGIGIPDEIKDKIFDVFTEAKRFGTAGEEPYGLGLSITKQIIEAHGGKIWFESENGKGTSFYIYLPF